MDTQKTPDRKQNKKILNRKNNARRISIPDPKICYGAITIKPYSTDTETDM